MADKLENVINQVDVRKDELMELLETFISFKTPAPPARNTAEAQNYIAKLLKEMEFDVDMWEVYPDDPNVVGVLKGQASAQHQSLIINGHIDVAEIAEDEQWESDPFTPHVKEDVIIGRGAADMKSGLTGALFAIRLLKDAGIKLPGDLIFQSVIGEEVGEAGTLECCRRGYEADFALVVDTSDLQIHGQGGVITGWVTIKSDETYHDAMRQKMIHAGGNVFAASAISKMVKIIDGLEELERHWAVTKSYPGFPPGTNTINPAVIEGGRHAAFIADECHLWITVHYYPDETYDEVAQEVENHLLKVAAADPWLRENPPIFEWGGTSMIEDRGEIFPSLEIDYTHEAISILADAHQYICKVEAVKGVSPSVTDGGWLGDAGIPTAIYGPGDFSNAHRVNEQLSIAELLKYTKVMIKFIYEWTHAKKGELSYAAQSNERTGE